MVKNIGRIEKPTAVRHCSNNFFLKYAVNSNDEEGNN